MATPGGGVDGAEFAGAGIPPLHAVVADHDEVLEARSMGEAGEVDGELRRTAGDHRDEVDVAGELGEPFDDLRLGVRPARVVDDR